MGLTRCYKTTVFYIYQLMGERAVLTEGSLDWTPLIGLAPPINALALARWRGAYAHLAILILIYVKKTAVYTQC